MVNTAGMLKEEAALMAGSVTASILRGGCSGQDFGCKGETGPQIKEVLKFVFGVKGVTGAQSH